ncbi:hypothetical protein J6590_042186 [Homalodisca vitripennis]|nr:hypothetical protein J6590_042186 [Homalodisca vitripennis]
MPKKFVGENSKAVAAKARKAAAQEEQAIRKQKQIEDEYWKDDDKNLAKKQARKEEQERKKMELLKKKAETKALMEEEVSSIKTAGKQPISKITRAQIVRLNSFNPLRSVVDYRSTAAVSLNARMSTIGRLDNVTACLSISNLLLFGI